MTCPEARGQLSALLDNALATDERSQVERHLAGCAECQRELERLRRTVGFLRAVEPPLAPAGFVRDVVRATRPWYRRALEAVFVPLSIKLPLEAVALAMVAVLGIQIVRDVPEVRREVRALGEISGEEQPVGVTTEARGPSVSARTDKPPGSGAASEPAPYRPPAAAPPATLPSRPGEPESQVPAPPATRGERSLSSPDAEVITEGRALFRDREAAERDRPAGARQDATGPEPAPPRGTTDDSLAGPAPESGRPVPSSKVEPTGATLQQSGDIAPGGPHSGPDVALRRMAPRASPLAERAERAIPPPDCCVRGTLAVTDRARAIRQLGELTQRLGGTEVTRSADARTTVVEVTVRRDAYPRLVEGLHGLGRLTVGRQAGTLAATVRMSVAVVE